MAYNLYCYNEPSMHGVKVYNVKLVTTILLPKNASDNYNTLKLKKTSQHVLAATAVLSRIWIASM